MSQEKNDILTAADSQSTKGESPFAVDAQTQADLHDLFVGDVSFLKSLDSDASLVSDLKKPNSAAGIRPLYLIAAANVLVTGILALVLWVSPAKVILSGQEVGTLPAVDANSPVVAEPTAGQAEVPHQPTAVESSSEQEYVPFDQAVSLKMADKLVEQGEFAKASRIFQQIMSNAVLGGQVSEEYRDYLKLRIATCLQQADQMTPSQESYLTDVLRSRSGLVRGLGYYCLSLNQFRRGEYLQARKAAYQAMALIRAFEDLIPENLEADLYFIAAESLTRYALNLYQTDQELPGRLWSNSLGVIWPADLEQSALCKALETSTQKLSEGAGGAQLQIDPHRPVGNQWSLVCMQSPTEEILVKVASQANLQLVWKTLDVTARTRPTTVYLPYVAEQYLAEVVAGSTGLVWKYDGQNVSVFMPDSYDDLTQHRADIVSETIAIWRRFLLRYRGEHRTANAHYALGRMYRLDQQQSAALAEFKVIQSHFENNPLAPFAYLEASQIRTEMKDYQGAKTDLNEMLLLYPDCTAADRATLCLAEASLESGQLAQSWELFNRVYQLNQGKVGRLQAAYGLGRCAFRQGQWAGAKTWLTETLSQIEDKSDVRVAAICLMLGRTLIELGENQQASAVLRASLESSLSDTDYVQIIEELVAAEMDQENYLEALNILESIPQSRLNQKDSCEALIWKSRVLRAIDAAPSAASLLRRKIEYITDSQLRAWLTLELAESYYAMGDYAQARSEINDVLADIHDAGRSRQAALLLANIAEQLGQPQQAEKICRTILANSDLDPAIRQKTFELLGRIYSDQQAFDKAALAFAGITPQEGDVP